jgi:hypothetical protein
MTMNKPKKSRRLGAIVPAVSFAQMGIELADMAKAIKQLDKDLQAAVARKPNKVLAQLVYHLKTTRAELALVQEQLQENNAVLKRYVEAMERVVVPEHAHTLGARA